MLETNKIYNMDCLEGLQQIDNESIDCIITDPPYGINLQKMNLGYSVTKNHNRDWDKTGLTKEQLKEIVRISKNQIIFGANNFSEILPNSRCWLIWDKRLKDNYRDDYSDCELIWTSFDKPARIFRCLWHGFLQDNDTGEKRYHPTQKPLKLIREIIEMFTNKNELICDPFMGSGTTAVACKMLDRNFIGFEIDENYCKIAEKRLQNIPKRLTLFNP